MILSFKLTIPREGLKYYRHRKVPKKEGMKLFNGEGHRNWYYNFGDGWGASVSVTKVPSKEKTRPEESSSDFTGYDWMIDEILKFGKILNLKERSILRLLEKGSWEFQSHVSDEKFYLTTYVTNIVNNKVYKTTKTNRTMNGLGLGKSVTAYSETLESPDLTLYETIKLLESKINDNETVQKKM